MATDVQRLLVGTQHHAVRAHDIACHPNNLAAWSQVVDGRCFARLGRLVEVQDRIREVEPAVAIGDEIVGRDEGLALIVVGQHRPRWRESDHFTSVDGRPDQVSVRIVGQAGRALGIVGQ